jgi:hypothetical protein
VVVVMVVVMVMVVMVVMVGLIKGSDRIIHEMMGL